MSNPFGRLATAKAALLMMGSTYVSFFFGLIVSALIARSIGPDDFGRYAFVVWISGVLVQFANNGLNTTGIRFVAENLGRGDATGAGAVHGWLLRRQWWCVAAVGAAFVVSVPWSAPSSWNASLWLFGGVVLVSLLAKALYLFGVSMAKGYGQFVVEAVSNVSVSSVNLVGVLVLFALGAPLMAYLMLFAAASAAYGTSAWVMLRRRKLVANTQPLEPEMQGRVRKHLVWTVVLTLAAALGNKAPETYLLSQYAGPAEVGFFAIAGALTRGGVELLAAGLNSVLMPLMGHAYGAGGASRVNVILGHSVRFYSFAGLLLAGVGGLWAHLVIVLMYGAQFQAATTVFQVMVLVAGFTLSQGAFGALLSTTDHQKVRAYVAALSVALATLAAVLLVPRYGLAGAMLAHAASSALIFVLIVVGIVRVFKVSLPWRELGRLLAAALVAALAAALCLWLGAGLVAEFVSGAVYVLVYVVATVALRAWRAEDIDAMMPLARRFPRLLGRLLPALAGWMRR